MSDADSARAIVGTGGVGMLSTLARDPAGYPFGSMVLYAVGDDGRPVVLISRLAEHTANAIADPRASLLVAEEPAPGEDPLAGGRVTLLGRLVEVPDPSEGVRAAYLREHPTAEMYVDFADFVFFRLETESVRYVGGFGRMSWVDVEEFASG